ncbi:hypothetical protein [Gelidibacter mesophilus]|uniref:hypothetical protein n=1 Tax=Gelidibacter mesophilus TaxID=169050 RepID=UPI0004150E04|nr:hypothetical protein [Gelidibacter mesophilus]
MTLVVGRITQGGIRVDSDSKITDPSIASNRNTVFSGLLKTIILNPNISVSYAGGVDTAQKAIEELYKLQKFEINEIKKLLLKIHSENDCETDFLIASLENQPLLYKISENKIDVSNSFQWIGDIKGFNIFQKEFFPNLKSQDAKHISTVHANAFDKVIENDQIESVGGFHITAHRTEFGIEYLFKMSLNMGRSETLTLKQGSNIIPWGNAGTGTFASCYLKSDNPYKPAIGIHFPIGNFGTLYYPKVSRKVIFYKDVNGFEFAEKVKSDYGIKIIGMIKNGEYMTRI